MIKTNSFLCCFKLETGGLVIGWFSLLSDVMSLIGILACIFLVLLFSCSELKDVMNNFLTKQETGSGVAMNSTMEADFDEACNIGRPLIIVLLVITALALVGFAFISFLCIKAVEHRDHVRVRPMMILMAIATILSWFGILSFNLEGVVGGIFYGLIYGYLFVVLYSLFVKFRAENDRGFTAHYQTAPMGKA